MVPVSSVQQSVSDALVRPLGPDRALGFFSSALYYAMRIVPWFFFRNLVARTLAKLIGKRSAATSSSTSSDLPKDAVVATLNQQGWSRLPPLLSPEKLREVQAFLSGQELVTADGSKFLSEQAPANVAVASYPLTAVLRCPHVLQLMNRPDVLEIAERYLGCRPTISGLRIDWSSPTDRGLADVQQFHRDYDDWKQVKLFVYLSDVDDRSGPHEFVATSHRLSGRLRAKPFRPGELLEIYGPDRFVRVTGDSGTCFMVDTWGIHKGNAPESGVRLLLQIQYSLLPIVNFDYRPVKMTLPAALDPYVNRLLIA